MTRRPGLGRGLDALIPEKDQDLLTARQSNVVVQIPVDNIKPNPKQPRGSINSSELEDLAKSIKEYGIIQPLIVSKLSDETEYTLIAGERRWRAAKIAGLPVVPAIVRTTSELEKLELALVENIQREDLNPLDRARAYLHLVEDYSLTHEEIGSKIGKNRVTITNTIRLLNLSPTVQKALQENLISEGHARALLSIQDHRLQDNALASILKLKLNVRQTEILSAKFNHEEVISNKKNKLTPEMLDVQDRLMSILNTKVHLNYGKKGGSIVIYYYSDEELNNLIEIFSSKG